MKKMLEVCLITVLLACAMNAQDPTKPVLRPGVSVQMLVSNQAVKMMAADANDATVVAITADGKVFLGTTPVETGALSSLKASTVYLKVDARTEFQKVITVLDALRGHSVSLLTAAPAATAKSGISPPYGVKIELSGK